ncbi:tetratricopeptide repeat protein [Phormidium sp. CLA17]|uniref:tetratricopeptide repeat protein n=1 Tax=Leptolyngbya sp. Cla-17 TaxID=2803751 RepID=UPI0014913981|nr:tetratricopeptide repeat protein [Leptolyngbya sp. Cla-17]MBM0743385.1 tetratricopeptide repeat protein [Leptolyngbya sp. Cla-17]
MPDLRIFQGRETELSQLNTWLTDPAVSMVGIRGEGGIGKSTLMAKVFAESLGFAGKFWADVRTGTSISALAERSLQELGVLPEQVRSLEEKDLIPRLLRQLQQGRYLLAIDNLESVLTAEGDWRGGYEDFLDGFQNLGSESVLLLAGREYPQKYHGWRHSRWLTVDQGLTPSEGAALLESLEVADTIENRATISEQVQGNPLALSLIAGWLRDEYRQPAERLVCHLSQHTDLFQLEGKHRGEANISVDRVLQWSVDRLTPAQRYLLTQVSVLRRAFEAELATALVLEPPVSDPDLHDLERRSLLQELPKLKPDGQRLFQLQPRIREFVQKQGTDLTPAHERAIVYFWSQRQTEFAPEDTHAAITEYAETFYHLCQLGHYADAAATVFACDAFLRRRGYYQLLVDLYTPLYTDWQPTPEQQTYAAVCTNLGNAYKSLGQYPQAIAFHRQSLAITREIGDRNSEANSLISLGNAYESLGQYPQAIDFYQQSLTITREIGACHGEAASLGNLGIAYKSLGQYPQAIDFYQKSLVIKRKIGDRNGEANSLGNLGNAYQSLGQYPQAIDFQQQSLAIQREIGDRNGKANSLCNLGNAYQSLGKYPQAIEFCQQSLTIQREIGDCQGEANSLCNLGNAYQSLGQYPQAINFQQQSLAIQREIGDRRGEATSLIGLGNTYVSLGQYPQAINFYQQSLAIQREIGGRNGEANSLIGLGNAYASLGQYPQAINFYQQSLAIQPEIGDRNGEANSLCNLGNAYQSLGKYPQAIEFCQQSLTIQREIGDRHGEGLSLFNMGYALARLNQHYEALQSFQQALAIYEALKLDYRVEQCKTAIAEQNQIIAVQPRTAPTIGTKRHKDDDLYTKSLPTKRKTSAALSSRPMQNWWLWFAVGLADRTPHLVAKTVSTVRT